jgi:hypothetical protein
MVAINVESTEDVVSYLTWTLLPNSNSMKISLKPMRSRTQTPNLISLGLRLLIDYAPSTPVVS